MIAAAVEIPEPAHASQSVDLSESSVRYLVIPEVARIEDSGLGIRDQRAAIKDQRLGALAGWARAESRRRDAAHEGDDLRALLRALAVPMGVVAVGYGRGCRIRRVRVPAAREPQESEAVGAVILSRSALAEQRNRREQPGA
jgi:hypothetical protein